MLEIQEYVKLENIDSYGAQKPFKYRVWTAGFC